MTRLGKLQKAEGQRRSPRISALEASCINIQGPALRTRGKKKTKLKPRQQLAASPNQGVKHEDIQKKNVSDQPSKPLSTSLPKKRILELVLDTLQRRDTYEIFAEPVDPNEVEDYYAIIKEPMDFGTMRAKLHEGMYKTLEQFEHDAFLIFNNAMDFNSSGTIYFRQARLINELAKKVFDVLRINPDKFEMEFSETRQQVSRRNQGDFREPTTHTKTTIDVPSRNVSCSSQTTSSRKSFRTNHVSSNTAKCVNGRDVEAPTGAKDNSRCRSFEVDRRSSYRPLSHHDKDESIYSTVYDKLKLLKHVTQQDIGYKDSLISFVKDLGPIAQKIAKRKLLGCEIHTASASVPQRQKTCAMISQFPYHPPNNKMKINAGDIVENVEGTLNAEKEKGRNSQGWSLRGNKVFTNQTNSQYSRANCVEYLNGSNHGYDKNSRMVLLEKSRFVNQEQLPLPVSILDKCQTNTNNVLESREEKNCMFQSRFDHQDRCHMQKPFCPTNEVSCSFKATKALKPDHIMPLATGFVFNVPYLKTRLDQINSSCNI